MISQINEIRERIRRGETAAQQAVRTKLDVIPDNEEESLINQESFNEYGTAITKKLEPVQKPPLYSALSPDGASGYQPSELNEVKRFHSIDPPNSVNCFIVTDEPNIYEKKR